MTQRGPIEAGIGDEMSGPDQGPTQPACRSESTENVLSRDRDAEPEARKGIHAAVAPRWLGGSAVQICRPALAVVAKKDTPADLPQVGCGGSYL
jgi:hypothetical protein